MREKLANSDQSHTKESLAHETPERHASGLTDNLKQSYHYLFCCPHIVFLLRWLICRMPVSNNGDRTPLKKCMQTPGEGLTFCVEQGPLVNHSSQKE